MKRTLLLAISLLGLLGLETGCSTTLAQPFEANKGQQITVFRLQNYESQPAAPGAATTNTAIPPQIQQWLTAGAQMLPPGLIPPGLLPGGTPAAAATTDAPRFQNFRILGSASINDKTQHDDIMKLFGSDSSFETPRQQCMFAEFGFRIGYGPSAGTVAPAATGTAAPLDILVSLSCDQVAMPGYSWPYGAKNGLTQDSTKKIVAIAQKAFGG